MNRKRLTIIGIFLTILSSMYLYNQQLKLENINYPTVGNVDKLRVMTFNIRGARNEKGDIQIDSLIQEIKNLEPNIIALEEVDVQLPRSNFVNQIDYISKELEMNYTYSPNINFLIGSYGNAIISRFPILDVEHITLPSKIEPRGIIKASIDISNKKINVYATHLGLNSNERRKKFTIIKSLLANDPTPKILLGDFNAKPTDKNFKTLRIQLNDPSHNQNLITHKPYSTQIDYVFHSRDFSHEDMTIVNSVVSDHNSVLCTLLLK